MKNCRGNHELYRVEDLECFLAYIPKAYFYVNIDIIYLFLTLTLHVYRYNSHFLYFLCQRVFFSLSNNAALLV